MALLYTGMSAGFLHAGHALALLSALTVLNVMP